MERSGSAAIDSRQTRNKTSIFREAHVDARIGASVGEGRGRWRNRDESVSTVDCSGSEDFISYFSVAVMGRKAQRETLRQQSDEWSAALCLSLSAVYSYCRGAADWGEEEEAE